MYRSFRPPCDELEVAVPRNADGAFAAAVNALQVAALDVVVERPAMDLEPLQHVLVADDVRKVLVLVPPSPSGDTLKRAARQNRCRD